MNSILTQEDDFDSGDFQPCYRSSDLGFLAICKHYLEAKEIPYFILGEDLLYLVGAAIPALVEEAILYLRAEDRDEFEDFLRLMRQKQFDLSDFIFEE